MARNGTDSKVERVLYSSTVRCCYGYDRATASNVFRKSFARDCGFLCIPGKFEDDSFVRTNRETKVPFSDNGTITSFICSFIYLNKDCDHPFISIIL